MVLLLKNSYLTLHLLDSHLQRSIFNREVVIYVIDGASHWADAGLLIKLAWISEAVVGFVYHIRAVLLRHITWWRFLMRNFSLITNHTMITALTAVALRLSISEVLQPILDILSQVINLIQVFSEWGIHAFIYCGRFGRVWFLGLVRLHLIFLIWFNFKIQI